LDISCPICGAEPHEKCRLLTGLPRFESHVERKWIARDRRREPEPLELEPVTE
jgi:hypothetical protein